MAERVIVHQDKDFQTAYWALDPADPESPEAREPRSVAHLHDLTPYGMLLASLGTCTAVVLHTYAQHHDVALDDVEIVLDYQRLYREDCKDCEEIGEYMEQVAMDIRLSGDLTPDQRERLYRVSKHCPVHRMLGDGIAIQSHLAEDAFVAGQQGFRGDI